MKNIRSSKVALGLIIAALVILSMLAFVWFGLFNFAADTPHSRPVFAVIEFVRDRSIRAGAAQVTVPQLTGEGALIRGAGNYQAMCAQCHLAPGKASTELSRGLYPSPPNLSRALVDPAEAFWTIKHGVKASGMPAWGKSMSDSDIWDLVSLVRQLPQLNAASYNEMVEKSSGHAHAGAPDGKMKTSAHPMEENAHAEMKDNKAPPTGSAPTGHGHEPGDTH